MRAVICAAAAAFLGGCGLTKPLTDEDMRQLQLGLQMMQQARPQAAPAPAPAFRPPVYCRTTWTGMAYQTVCD